MTIVIGCWLYILLQNLYVVAVYTSFKVIKWNSLIIIELYKLISFWSFDIYDGLTVLMLWLCVSGVYWAVVELCVVVWRVSQKVQGVWFVGSLFIDQ